MIQTYHYDLAGNLRRLEETGGTGELPSRVLECSYDGANRLATESDMRGSDPAIVTTYGYDAADNRVVRVITGGADAGATSYEIGPDNELSSLTRPDSSVVSFGYDATGARTSRTDDGRADSYGYDTWDRLLSLDLQTPADPAVRGVFNYSYDARTRRMWREELGEGTVLSFVGGVSVQEYGVGSVSTPPAPPTIAPTVEYVRGPDMGGGVGGLLYSVRSGNASLVHSSARGDVIERRDEDGTVSWQGQYEAFGKHPVEEGSNPDRQRANSKEEDPTGLLNEGFRYRDLETGTFITRDPIGFKDGPNLYTYVHQNPWTHFDPEGLELTVTTVKETEKSKFLIFNRTMVKAEHTTLVLTGAFIDSSSAHHTLAQQKQILGRIEKQIKKDFTGGEGTHDWKIETHLRVVSDRRKIEKSDHVFELKDRIPNTDAGTLGQTNKVGGKNIQIRADLVSLHPGNPTNVSLERTGSHEFGHSAGLHHPHKYDTTNPIKIGNENLMNQTQYSGSHRVERNQIERIQKDYEKHRLNKD